MSTRGPAPKPQNKRARRNKDAIEMTTYEAVPSGQPPLMENVPWPPQTLTWWEELGKLPQTKEFNAVQWDHLAMVALIHADIWGNGNTRAIPDFQKAMAEYPILPASMLRMRVQFVTANDIEERTTSRQSRKIESAQSRYGALRAVN